MQTLARDRLVERLRAGAGTKVTLVAAPAGYGKTTLLGIWREAEEATRPVAWLSLDEGDNDPVVLWSYILAALRGSVRRSEWPRRQSCSERRASWTPSCRSWSMS